MTKKPSQPNNVDVTKLQAVLTSLQELSDNMSQPRPGTWQDVQGSLADDLYQSDGKGIEGQLPTGIGSAYADNVYNINRARTTVTTGLTTLISMLSTTISQHSTADSDAADTANNTGGTGGTSGTPTPRTVR